MPLTVRYRPSRSSATLLLLAALIALGGCGAEEPAAPPPAPEPAAVSGEGVSHVHGVGINPADDAVIVATHSGLFRVGPGEQRPQRIGDRRQDTMGFTVVGPDRFLGSGHPDLRDDLPPLLGLIRSDNAGRSWQPVSLLGQADFHVLRSAGRRVYGANASDGTLLASSDGGHRWTPRTPPTDVIDLAIDPEDPDRVVVSGVDGIFASADGGRRWRPRDAELAGLLAWTAAGPLVLVDARGEVHASEDGGRSFAPVGGNAGGQPVAFAAHEQQLLVALPDNSVRASDDGGRTWYMRVRGR